MKRKKSKFGRAFLREKRIDLIFAGIAFVFLFLTIILLVRYTGLRNQNQARPEEYGMVMQELNDVKTEKSSLESKIDTIKREIDELNRKISSLGGN